MKKIIFCILIFAASLYAMPTKVVIIRHAEKPDIGNNLSCQGFNRALELTKVLPKFGSFKQIYVPKIEDKGDSSEHLRMFQTASPYAIYNNSDINSEFKKTQHKQVVTSILKESGDILVVWPHGNIIDLANTFGTMSGIPKKWKKDDFDTVFIITFENGNPSRPMLNISSEGLHPSSICENF